MVGAQMCATLKIINSSNLFKNSGLKYFLTSSFKLLFELFLSFLSINPIFEELIFCVPIFDVIIIIVFLKSIKWPKLSVNCPSSRIWSKILNVKVYNNGKVYSQKYSKGKVASKISIYKCSKKLKGTEISFIPDKDIFDNISFNPKKLYQFIKMKAVLVRETSILFKVDKELIKDSTPSKELFYYKKGIEDFLKKYSNSKIKLFDKYFYINSFLNENEKCEVIVSFIKNEKNMFKSYCNTIETPDGGSHENGYKIGILKAIKMYGQKNQISKAFYLFL